MSDSSDQKDLFTSLKQQCIEYQSINEKSIRAMGAMKDRLKILNEYLNQKDERIESLELELEAIKKKVEHGNDSLIDGNTDQHITDLKQENEKFRKRLTDLNDYLAITRKKQTSLYL